MMSPMEYTTQELVKVLISHKQLNDITQCLTDYMVTKCKLVIK